MTQEIACFNNAGILLCSDSLVVEHVDVAENPEPPLRSPTSGPGVEQAVGEARELPVLPLPARYSFRKLYSLGSHAAILSAGAKVGIDLSIRLGELVAYRGLYDVEAIYPLAREFLSQEYGRLLEEGRDWFASHPEAYRRLYFVVAGHTFRDPSKPFRLYLLGSEDLELPLQLLPTGTLLTMPRRLAFEMKLAAALSQSSLDSLADLCLGYLRRLEEKEPDRVGGPYYAATVTGEGFKWVSGAGPS